MQDAARRPTSARLGSAPGASRNQAGPGELNIPAIKGIGDSLIYLVDRWRGKNGAQEGDIGNIGFYDVDFEPLPGASARTRPGHGLDLHRPPDAQRAPRPHEGVGRLLRAPVQLPRDPLLRHRGPGDRREEQGDDQPLRQDPHPDQRGRQREGRARSRSTWTATTARASSTSRWARAICSQTVDALRASGVKLLDTIDTYYELVDKRIPGHGENVAELQEAQDPDRRQGGRVAAADLQREPARADLLRVHPAQGRRGLRRGQLQGAVRVASSSTRCAAACLQRRSEGHHHGSPAPSPLPSTVNRNVRRAATTRAAVRSMPTTPARRTGPATRAADHDTYRRLYERQAAQLSGLACDDFIAALPSLGDPGPHPALRRDQRTAVQGHALGSRRGAGPDPRAAVLHAAGEPQVSRSRTGSASRRSSTTSWSPTCSTTCSATCRCCSTRSSPTTCSATAQGGLKAHELGAGEKLARLYWYTVEFGLIRQADGLRAYGAGILSSVGELQHAVRSTEPHRLPLDLLRTMRTRYKIDSYQSNYFVIESFAQLFEMTAPDFTPLYRALATQPDIEAGVLLPGERHDRLKRLRARPATRAFRAAAPGRRPSPRGRVPRSGGCRHPGASPSTAGRRRCRSSRTSR